MEKPKKEFEVRQTKSAKEKYKRLLNLLEGEIWPQIPNSQLGVRLSKAEEEEILGFEE